MGSWGGAGQDVPDRGDGGREAATGAWRREKEERKIPVITELPFCPKLPINLVALPPESL